MTEHDPLPLEAVAAELGGDWLAEAEAVQANTEKLPEPPDPYATDDAPKRLTDPTDLERFQRGLDGADPDVHEWLAEPDREYDFILPGILERAERAIVTAAEGAGKTTLLRQMSVTSAAGIDPFNFEPMDPVRVMFLDCENSDRHSKRQFRPLVAKAGSRLAPGNLIPIIRPAGLDLLHKEDQKWLTERVKVNRPELLVLGPSYKLATGDPTDEQTARTVTAVIDDLRANYEVAIILESHSPHGTGGNRPGRPYGASLWLRWPEFGLELTRTGQLKHWRGARDERSWPAALKRGGEWPWTIDPTGQLATGTRLGLVQVLGQMEPARWTDWRNRSTAALSISAGTFKNHQKALVVIGLVDRTGTGNHARYVLTDKGRQATEQAPPNG